MRGVFCACTFSGGVAALEPSYAQLEHNLPGFKSAHNPGNVDVRDLLDMCPHTCPVNIDPTVMPPQLISTLDLSIRAFLRTAEDARISVPPTTVMLENGSMWDAARLSVAHGKLTKLLQHRLSEVVLGRGA